MSRLAYFCVVMLAAAAVPSASAEEGDTTEKVAKAAAVGGVVGVATVAGGGSGVLGAVGFGAAGVVKASIAAGIQSGIGNVVAGSAFAKLTSLGMTGALGPVGVGVGLLASAGYYLFA